MNIKDEIARQKEDIRFAHWKCCLNCKHFIRAEAEGLQPVAICKLAALASPPLEVIASGCELWEDAIPF